MLEQSELDELWQRRKAQTIRLMEIADLTRQLLQALDRRDEMSVQIILSMREEPVRRLFEMDESLKRHILTLPRKSAIRARDMLNGSPPEIEEENRLCEQTAQYRKLLESTIALDRQANIRLGGKRSFYNMFRES